MNDSNRAVPFVAVGIVTLCSVITLGLVWGLGVRVEHQLAEFGVALPASTQLAFQLRTAMTAFALANIGVAVLVAKRANAVSLLVATIAVQILSSGLYVWALQVPYALADRPVG